MTKEQWLTDLAKLLEGSFPNWSSKAYAVSMGFPSRGALSKKRKRIGECWPDSKSPDGTHNVFISPVLTEPLEVASTLLHELCHVEAGCKAGHRSGFSKLAKAVGLEKPWTATQPSEALKGRLNGLLAGLPPYPHAGLNAASKDKQSTRNLLLTCAEHGIKLRIAKATYEAGQPFTHGEGCKLELEGGDDSDS